MNQASLQLHLDIDKNLVAKGSTTQRILEIRLQAPATPQTNHRPDLNLALVLDRSGSMHGDKLTYVKQAASHVLDQLQAQDQVSLVAYDDQAYVIAHSVNVTNGNRFELKQLVSSIDLGGGTNLRDGWLTGCKLVASSARDGTINRTMLLTDGQANIGETDPQILAQHAFELYKDTISTSTFGVGYDFNEHLLEAMSNRGGGNFHYIEHPADLTRIFLKEFDELVGVTARKVEIKLDIPKHMHWQVLGGWSAEYRDGSLHIYVGDMLAAKTQDIYVKLNVPPAKQAADLAFTVKAFGQGQPGQVYEDDANILLHYAGTNEVDPVAVNQALMERFSLVELADTAIEALKLERRGERQAASQLVNDNINRNQPYINPTTAMNYRGMSTRMEQGMDEADRKRSHADTYRQKRNKESEAD